MAAEWGSDVVVDMMKAYGIKYAPLNLGGTYRALLVPGIYEVTTKPKIGFGGLKPGRVKVRSGHVDHLDFFADTGIR